MRNDDDRIRMFINEIKYEVDVGLLMTTKHLYVCYGCKLSTHPRTVREGDGIVQTVWRIHADWTILLGLEVSFTYWVLPPLVEHLAAHHNCIKIFELVKHAYKYARSCRVVFVGYFKTGVTCCRIASEFQYECFDYRPQTPLTNT